MMLSHWKPLICVTQELSVSSQMKRNVNAVGPGQAQIVLRLWASERFLEMIYAEHRVITPLLWVITMDTLKPVERVTRSTRKIHSIRSN